ncbi:hypothetical protein DN752_06005 [Echinicola strongylocentroti]|uniref:Response regulator n=2 Tax=Echinicola strongylocentroti TaxID=1795355 RepID=A0A2Z4IH13_9BACT|nr:hypothetical protein DN752_06005 [Echinicola strongylocentroti]
MGLMVKLTKSLVTSQKGIVVSNSYIDPKISKVLKGDFYRINQLLLYIVEYLWHFAEKRRLDIICELAKEHPHHQYIHFKINGVAHQSAQYIVSYLSNDTQHQPTNAPEDPSTALSICRGLVNLLQCGVSVKNIDSNGSSLIIRFMLSKGTASGLAHSHHSDHGSKTLNKQTILVADSNPINRSIITTIIKQTGLVSQEASDGVSALQYLEKNPIDLVLVNHHLPVMDGIQTAHFIRQKAGASLPIIAMMAYPIEANDPIFAQSSLNDFLTLPFDEQQLMNKIQYWLNKKTPPEQQAPKRTQQLYDLDRLDAIAPGNKDFKQKMVALFKSVSESSVQELKEALDKNDEDSVRRIAHRLKPTITTMGIDSLKQPITDLEKGILPQNEKEKAILNLENVLTKVNEELEKMEW